MRVHFDIIVVSFNSGERLRTTLNSIYGQDYWDYEVVIEDALSTDGSLSLLKEQGFFENKHINDRTQIFTEADDGIYDGMNKALSRLKSSGEEDRHDYVMFLNCGDVLCDRQTLGKVADFISERESEGNEQPYIFYGDQFNEITQSVISSSPKLNEFALFRNVPCHQVCFYDRDLFAERGYDTVYRVRADYEHFLYCIYEKKTDAVHMDIIVSRYEGGGYSETMEGKEISAKEHIIITDRYMGKNAKKYRFIMSVSGAGIRTKMAENPRYAGIYNRIKTGIYKRR